MAVNYLGICVTNVIKHNLTLNGGNKLRHFKSRKSRVKITTVIYRGIFITLAPDVIGTNVIGLNVTGPTILLAFLDMQTN